MATTLVAQSFTLPTGVPLPQPKLMLGTQGVDREMFTCRITCRPLVVQLLCIHTRGVNHPTRLTQRVRQQIKCLTLWRSTFYVADFLPQPAMSSVKELKTLYLVICDLCERFMGYATRNCPSLGATRYPSP